MPNPNLFDSYTNPIQEGLAGGAQDGAIYGGSLPEGAASFIAFFAGLAAVVIIAFLLFAVVTAVATYVLQGIAYYKLAKAQGSPRPWLSWIPFAKNYLIGDIGDNINAQHGKKTASRKILLITSIVANVFSIGSVSFHLPGYINSLINGSIPNSLMNLSFMSVFSLVSFGFSIWYLVTFFIVHNTIYKEYAPKSATPFLIFTIIGMVVLIAPFLAPIFVLTLCKNATPIQNQFKPTKIEENN